MVKIQIEIFPILFLFLAVYNIFYGAFCWRVAGIQGLLLGSIFMVCGTIVGVLLRKCRNCETKREKLTLKE